MMMISIIGSIVYTMLYVVDNFSMDHNETIQYLWCCFTGILLIPAYKGVFLIHALWLKMLKQFRYGDSDKDEDTKEIPFFKEPTAKVDVKITEYSPKDRRNIPSPSLEEVNEKIKKIRSSADEKLSQIRKEDIANPTKESSYFANKYTGEKSILVDTIFAKEKATATSDKATAAAEKDIAPKIEESLKTVAPKQEAPAEQKQQNDPQEEKKRPRNKKHNNKKYHNKSKKGQNNNHA
ncbi:hypothetical protein HMPREF1551_01713 [Capnocytophaga sp. oral taxon 863 str. F0517]|nr:hypothetical protein HMPREF1551_01713 [Capnocytophaga sp. oral taxon 863 str. F0517]